MNANRPANPRFLKKKLYHDISQREDDSVPMEIVK
jgi:hypothetical protein